LWVYLRAVVEFEIIRIVVDPKYIIIVNVVKSLFVQGHYGSEIIIVEIGLVELINIFEVGFVFVCSARSILWDSKNVF